MNALRFHGPTLQNTTFGPPPKKIQEESGGSDTDLLPRNESKRPPLYQVILHNDDYTTMDFVIHVLQVIFRKTGDEAKRIMLQIHHEGQGVCGVYTYEIAEAKMIKVIRLAREHGHPLKCSMTPE